MKQLHHNQKKNVLDFLTCASTLEFCFNAFQRKLFVNNFYLRFWYFFEVFFHPVIILLFKKWKDFVLFSTFFISFPSIVKKKMHYWRNCFISKTRNFFWAAFFNRLENIPCDFCFASAAKKKNSGFNNWAVV